MARPLMPEVLKLIGATSQDPSAVFSEPARLITSTPSNGTIDGQNSSDGSSHPHSSCDGGAHAHDGGAHAHDGGGARP